MSSADNHKPLTAKERKRNERARKAAAGIAEVRGIHAHVDDHTAVKDEANKHAERLNKRRAAAAKRAAKSAPAKQKT